MVRGWVDWGVLGMTWFKVDDGFYRHRKVRRLGKDRVPAVGLWTLAGNWCADNTTDGFVADEQVELWDQRHRYARRLVDVGLWHETEVDGEHGYQFHQWADYQPTREQVLDKRRKRSEAGRLGGIRSGQSRRTKHQTPDEANAEANAEADASRVVQAPEKQTLEAQPNPVPTRPVGTHLGRESPDPNAREQPPPPRCRQHLDQPAAGPCGPCGEARRAREAWNRHAELDRITAIRRCRLCDAEGWRYEPGRRVPITPYLRCTHTPLDTEEETRDV